jgi:hypothetical protein
MRRATVLLAIIALLAAPVAVLAAEELTAELTPEAEVPAPTVPDDYEGSGSASATISDDESEIAYEVSYENLTGAPVASHIHFGAEGVAGGIILPLAHGDSPFSGTLTEADFTPVDGGPQTYAEALEAIRAGDTYINIHTEQNAPGEIRGQLTMVSEPDEATPPPTSMSGSETPPGGGSPTMSALLLALIGLAVFVVALQRFRFRRV